MNRIRCRAGIGTVIIALAQGCASSEGQDPGAALGGVGNQLSSGGEPSRSASSVGGTASGIESNVSGAGRGETSALGGSAPKTGSTNNSAGAASAGAEPNSGGAPNNGGASSQAGAPNNGGTSSQAGASNNVGSTAIVNYINGRKFSCMPLPDGDNSGCAYPASSCNGTSLGNSDDPQYATIHFPLNCSVLIATQHPYYPNSALLGFCMKTGDAFNWICPM